MLGMNDLEKAKERLNENDLTLSIVKYSEVIFETASHGISGFLEAIEKFGDELKGASVADRVVGKAIALLCVYAKVKAIYAVILSEKAGVVLKENAVHYEYEKIVKNIHGDAGAVTCPFEKLSTEISNPSNAYRRLKALQNFLKKM